jgi:hypothetical protein
VSLSSRKQVRIALAPHQVSLVRLSRGLTPRVIDSKRMACEVRSEPNWAVPMEALREMLRHPNVSRGKAAVVLSDHFVRYLVLPWNPDLVSDAELLEFARARFAKVFGEAAQRWSVLVSPAPPGHPQLAAAVERPLVDALAHAFAGSMVKPVSIQPAFVAQFNEAHSRLAPDAWLVSAERGRLLLARIADGRWCSVRVRPMNECVVTLGEVLEQERMLIGDGEQDAKVYVTLLDEVTLDLAGLQAEVLAAADPTRLRSDKGFTLAMTGAA